VAPSRIQSPITPFTPRELARGIERQIRAFVRCAKLAREAGYDGVEVMGSEGYSSTSSWSPHQPAHDDWGGSYENRMRLPLEIARACARPWAGLHHHLPPVHAGPGPRRQQLGRGGAAGARVAAAGATMINTGIGWHEARIPPSPPACRAPALPG
jgi:2,4-dienoyl-CoA reductase (NADPH2)